MTKLVDYKQLSNFSNPEESSSTVVQKVQVGQQNYYFKHAPAELKADKQALRLLNEAICGKVVELIQRNFAGSFSAPPISLVVKDGKLMGLLSSAIIYDTLENYNTGMKGLIKALETSAFGIVTTVRYFLCDPDAKNNVGYDKSRKIKTYRGKMVIENADNPTHAETLTVSPLASIDYGLANCLYLKKHDALTDGELSRLPEMSEAIFDLTVSNILSGAFQPVDKDYIDFLAQHNFLEFIETIIKLNDSANSYLVKEFFLSITKTFTMIDQLVNSSSFKQTIENELSLDELALGEQLIAQDILESLITHAAKLHDACQKIRALSPDDLRREVSANSDGRITPFVLEIAPGSYRSSSVAFINNLLSQGQAEQVITPLSTSIDINSQIFKPIALRTQISLIKDEKEISKENIISTVTTNPFASMSLSN